MKKFVVIILVFLFSLAISASALATTTPATPEVEPPPSVSLINPIDGTDDNPAGQTDIRKILGNIVAAGLTLVGAAALLVFVYGGFTWLTAAGKEERIKAGSQAMMWAVIGLFIIFSSYAILKLVLTSIGAKDMTGSPWGVVEGTTETGTTAKKCVAKAGKYGGLWQKECNKFSPESACEKALEGECKWDEGVCFPATNFDDTYCAKLNAKGKDCNLDICKLE